MILPVPVDVLFEVLFSQEIVGWVELCVAGRVVRSEDILADTSEEEAVSLLTHFDLY